MAKALKNTLPTLWYRFQQENVTKPKAPTVKKRVKASTWATFRIKIGRNWPEANMGSIKLYFRVTARLPISYCRIFFFLVGYVEERPWWPIQSRSKGIKKKASS